MVIVLWSPVMLRMCMVYMLRLVYRVSTVVAVPLPEVTLGLAILVLVSSELMKCPWDVLTSIGQLVVPNWLSVVRTGRPRLMFGPEKFRFGLTTIRLVRILVLSIVLIRCTSLLRMLPIMLRLQWEALVLGIPFAVLVS